MTHPTTRKSPHPESPETGRVGAVIPGLIAVMLLVHAPSTADQATPRERAGADLRQHHSDRPRLAVYGGIGLYPIEDGRWTGYRVSDPADVDRLVDRCADHGITQISAHFAEEHAPSHYQTVADETGNPLIHRLIRKAHEHNVLVYADLPVFAHVEMDRAFTDANPEMFTRAASGELDTHMLSPAYDEVRRYKRELLMSFVKRYAVDGVHLDFIRFPYYTHDLREGACKHGYDAPILEAYRAARGLPADHSPPHDDAAWVRFRSGYVTRFIYELRDELRQSGNDIPVAVYNSGIYGREDSLRTVLQDWAQWEADGLVHEHHPMFLMTGGVTNLVHAAESLIDIKSPDSIVFGPIFLAEGFGRTRPTPDMVRDAARRLILAGCDGLWFCRASEIEENDLWPVVEEISQWSISRIRSEQADPAFVNLLTNPTFADGMNHWRSDTSGSATLAGKGVLRLEARPDRATELSQAIAFEPLSYMPVASLDVAFEWRGSGFHTDAPVVVILDMSYLNGESESHRQKIAGSTDTWLRETWRVPIRTDFKELVLEDATLRIRIPSGAGQLRLRNVVVERDQNLYETAETDTK